MWVLTRRSQMFRVEAARARNGRSSPGGLVIEAGATREGNHGLMVISGKQCFSYAGDYQKIMSASTIILQLRS
jgi:hypothetical protein